MLRDIIFLKDEGLLKALLDTKLCQDTGNYIIKCKDDKEVMQAIQVACDVHMSVVNYKHNYKLCFANENDYKDNLTV